MQEQIENIFESERKKRQAAEKLRILQLPFLCFTNHNNATMNCFRKRRKPRRQLDLRWFCAYACQNSNVASCICIAFFFLIYCICSTLALASSRIQRLLSHRRQATTQMDVILPACIPSKGCLKIAGFQLTGGCAYRTKTFLALPVCLMSIGPKISVS
jgi:hypothetical protein